MSLINGGPRGADDDEPPTGVSRLTEHSGYADLLGPQLVSSFGLHLVFVPLALVACAEKYFLLKSLAGGSGILAARHALQFEAKSAAICERDWRSQKGINGAKHPGLRPGRVCELVGCLHGRVHHGPFGINGF
jgi:hypothetical protein